MCCDKKKCKKACVVISYYFDISKAQVAEPVLDKYAVLGGNTTYTLFGSGNIYSENTYSNIIGGVEFTNKTIQNANPTSPMEPRVVADVSGYLLDGVSSVSFKYYFTSKNGLPAPGLYNTIAYSSTGIYYNKKCYISFKVLDDGVSYELDIVACDNKKTCKEKLSL